VQSSLVQPTSRLLQGKLVSREPRNIDERDREDPRFVSEYADDIYAHFKVQERETSHVPPRYMAAQPEINENMRSILVDWLVGVQYQFKLGPETLYLAVHIVDRYCNLTEVPRCKLQLVGAAALFTASKYEEVYRALQVQDIIAVCDNLYSQQEIVKMETLILSALGFKISAPTAHVFLLRYLKAAHADEKMTHLSCYILEGTLLSYPLMEYLPSQLAAASVLIARDAMGRNPWSPTFLKCIGYSKEQVSTIATAILDNKKANSLSYTAVDTKYSSKRFGRISKSELSHIW
jgi:G2/mitotic-specific cyclin-B, other